MNNIFNITYHDSEIPVTEIKTNDEKNLFKAEFKGKEILIKRMEDNDGAFRWIDAKENHETKWSREIGAAIELYKVKH